MKVVLWILFWFLYFPLILILRLLLFWHPKIAQRVAFERKNNFEYLAQSFKDKNINADLCFQFSSEGELQQVASLVEDAITSGKRVELVYFSPSVEKNVRELASKHFDHVRYFRYPFLTLFPFMHANSFTHWVTAKKLVMVRYDLFPEFLLWAVKKGHDLRLVWMTFKKERHSGKKNWWKGIFLSKATLIFFASELDKVEGEKLGVKGDHYDFRIEQIRRRITLREKKFSSHFPLYPELIRKMESFPREKRVIFGNVWPSDLFLLDQMTPGNFLMLVPHQLDENSLDAFRDYLKNKKKKFFELDDGAKSFEDEDIILVNKKGILCELYADFGNAYVGGGFETSIHSVLEPLVAGVDKISCGPLHHRSTEFDIALEAGRITEVNTPEEVVSWLNIPKKAQDHAKITELLDLYLRAREKIISC